MNYTYYRVVLKNSSIQYCPMNAVNITVLNQFTPLSPTTFLTPPKSKPQQTPPPHSSPNPSPQKNPPSKTAVGTRCRATSRRPPARPNQAAVRSPYPPDSTRPGTPPERTRTGQKRRCSRCSRHAFVHSSGTGGRSPASGYARRSAA